MLNTATVTGGTRSAFVLPPLQYSYEALEPHVDRLTMQLHHDKHHATYVTNLNKALEGYPALAGLTLHELLGDDLAAVPDAIRTAVRDNGGGHSNHSMFWTMLSPDGGAPSGALRAAIEETFGTIDSFKEQFARAALGRFGSGWAWLVKDGHRSLDIISTPNQDSPIMGGWVPIIGVDVWEHAYYLKHQNRRADYLAALWNVVNWRAADERFQIHEL